MARLTPLSGACIALAALTLTACGGGSDDPPPTQRQTTLGVVIGSDDSATSGTYAWKGIPYAEAPVGALRWKAPADIEPWTSPKTSSSATHARHPGGSMAPA